MKRMKNIERVENRGDAKGMPLTVKGRRVSKDYLIENGIIEDLGVAPEKRHSKMDRQISLQAAIDALDRFNVFGYVEERWETLRDALQALPSARPEIIHCGECKHRDPEDHKCDCGHGILWQLPRDDKWYCADAERRTDEH